MRNQRSTLQVRTAIEVTDPTDRKVSLFPLGPFTVQCTPWAYEHYTRYTLLANGVPIRDQISYPEEEDGWQGLAFCKSNHTLTKLETEALKEFYHQQSHARRRVK